LDVEVEASTFTVVDDDTVLCVNIPDVVVLVIWEVGSVVNIPPVMTDSVVVEGCVVDVKGHIVPVK
jgi:hypothetical protein